MAKEVQHAATVMAKIKQTIDDARIPGMTANRVDSFMAGAYASWELGWAIEGSITVSLAHGDNGKRVVAVTVTWPSSTYSPVRARACAVLHGQVADLASLISAQWEGIHVEVSG